MQNTFDIGKQEGSPSAYPINHPIIVFCIITVILHSALLVAPVATHNIKSNKQRALNTTLQKYSDQRPSSTIKAEKISIKKPLEKHIEKPKSKPIENNIPENNPAPETPAKNTTTHAHLQRWLQNDAKQYYQKNYKVDLSKPRKNTYAESFSKPNVYSSGHQVQSYQTTGGQFISTTVNGKQNCFIISKQFIKDDFSSQAVAMPMDCGGKQKFLLNDAKNDDW